MSVKNRAGAQQLAEQPRADRLGALGAAMFRFLAGFLMAAGRFALPAAPFGVSMVAASGTGLGGAGAWRGPYWATW